VPGPDQGAGDRRCASTGPIAAARARLDAAYRALLAALDTLVDDDLGRTTPGKDYTTYVLLHGVVQHTLWHGGQIALLRRALQVSAT